jgi:hypothetical protein
MAKSEPAALVLLIYKVPSRKRAGLLKFLREAFPVYEAPGGIHMSLLESQQQDGQFVEIAAYETDEDFRLDQIRVESDPRMKEVLGRWQKFIEGRPQVLLVRNVAVSKRRGNTPRGPKRRGRKGSRKQASYC